MTREEAARHFKEQLDVFGGEHAEAMKVAIEALSVDAEPKRVLQGYNKGANIIQTIRHEELTQIANTRKAVESADAVPQTEHDREWIIGCIKHDGFIHTHRFDKANQIILEALKARPTGEWILYENQRQEDVDNGNYLYICSECGKSDIHAKTQKVPFCWWCGADMKGGDSE